MCFQIIGMLLLVLFYGCYFIKMTIQHHKGIQTDQLGKGKVGFVRFVEIATKIAACIVPVAEIVSIILNTVRFSMPIRIVGVCIGMAGVILFIISILTMRDNWRAGVSMTDQTELVTSGIYQISRNPAFLGFDFIYIGIVLLFFNWLLFAVSFLAMLTFHLQIVNVEEKFLLETFGDSYLRYKQKVCRYLGRKR